MSSIDMVYHEVIGQINGIPLYRLKEDVPSHKQSIIGKCGDVLLGGGSGETSAMRIALPEAIGWFTMHDDAFMGTNHTLESLVTTIWSNNEAYEFITMYKTLGYDPEECPIETWLGEHIISFLLKKYPHEYEQYVGQYVDDEGERTLSYDGSICTEPEKEWVESIEEWFRQLSK